MYGIALVQIMDFRSISLSYLGITLLGIAFGFSLISLPKANAMNIYNDQMPTIGLDADLHFSPYQSLGL